MQENQYFLTIIKINFDEIKLFLLINFIITKRRPQMQAFQWEEKDSSTPFWIHMIAGSCAGITQHISMLPLDNIKTHCQAGSKFRLTEIVKNIYQTGGLKNFYSGSSILAMGCIPAHAIYFSIYEKAKQVLNCELDQNDHRFALVGVLASLFHDSIMTPTEVVKQRLQIYRTENQWISTRQLIKSMYKNEGIISFYRSFFVNYFMSVPFSSIIVLMNEKLKKLFKVKEGDHHLNYYLCGGIAGGLASIPTTPFDVIKTRLNTQTCLNGPCGKRSVCEKMAKKTQKFSKSIKNPSLIGQPAQMLFVTANSQIKYHNILDTTTAIFKQEGMAGFFSGLRMRVAIQSFSSAIAWGTYQVIKSGLEKSNPFQH